MIISLVRMLEYVLYHRTTSDPKAIWWDKQTVHDIAISHAVFRQSRASLLLPQQLMGLETTVDFILGKEHLTRKDFTSHMRKLLEPLGLPETLESVRSTGPGVGYIPQKTLGKRPSIVEPKAPSYSFSGSPVSSQSHSPSFIRSAAHAQPITSRNHPTYASAQPLLMEELQYHCAPSLMRLPPILLESHIANGSYQQFYEELRDIVRSKTIQDAFVAFTSSFSEGSYEKQMAKFMHVVLEMTAEKFGHKALNVMSSKEVTIRKTNLGGIKSHKRDPNIVIFLTTAPLEAASNEGEVASSSNDCGRDRSKERGSDISTGKKGRGKGRGRGKRSEKDGQEVKKLPVLGWPDALSVGEMKPNNQPAIVEQARGQVLTAVQNEIRAQPNRMSEQAFSCCGGVFRFFHFDPEGYAISDPYDACDPKNLLLLINHTLLLSTRFTLDAVFAPSTTYERVDLLTKHKPAGIRGRRLLVYKVRMGDKYVVEKLSWPTIRGDTPQEVLVYNFLQKHPMRHQL
jgi:hypothetical protein